MSAPIRVFIVSRNRLFADALAALLARRGELLVAGAAPDVAQLPAGVEILLIDAGIDAGETSDALARTRGARDSCAACKPIVVGLRREDELLIDFIEAGAQGYVLQGTSPEALVEAIRAVHGGRSGCSARLAAAVVERIITLEKRRNGVRHGAFEPLTAREREVLGWIATGRCNKDIGHRLRISVQTVKNHVHSILGKLGARRRREALRIAYELGVLRDWHEPPAGS